MLDENESSVERRLGDREYKILRSSIEDTDAGRAEASGMTDVILFKEDLFGGSLIGCISTPNGEQAVYSYPLMIKSFVEHGNGDENDAIEYIEDFVREEINELENGPLILQPCIDTDISVD